MASYVWSRFKEWLQSSAITVVDVWTNLTATSGTMPYLELVFVRLKPEEKLAGPVDGDVQNHQNSMEKPLDKKSTKFGQFLKALVKKELDLEIKRVEQEAEISASRSVHENSLFEHCLVTISLPFSSSGDYLSISQKQIKKFTTLQNTDQRHRGILVTSNEKSKSKIFSPLDLSKSNVELNVHTFELGTIVNLDTFVSHTRSRSSTGGNPLVKNLVVNFQHDLRKIYLTFELKTFMAGQPRSRTSSSGQSSSDEEKKDMVEYKIQRGQLRLEYNRVQSVIVDPGREETTFYFCLQNPPLYFEYAIRPEADSDKEVTDSEKNSDGRFKRRAFLPMEIEGERNIGKCTTLKLVIQNVKKQKVSHWTIPSFALGLSTDPMVKSTVDPWDLISNFKHFNDFLTSSPIPVYFGHLITCIKEPVPKVPKEVFEDFPVLYSFKCCQSLSDHLDDDLVIRKVWNPFWNNFIENVNQDRRAVIETCYELANFMERSSLFRIDQAFKAILQEKKKLTFPHEFDPLTGGTTKIRRAIITPSNVILLPPQPFIDSRMMRMATTDYVLRIAFRDDDGTTLGHTMGGVNAQEKFQHNFQGKRKPDMNHQSLEQIIKKHLGGFGCPVLKIGEREYEFLGCSSSQLRDHSMVFYAQDEKGRKASHLRQDVGKLHVIHSVGKYIARLGQVFSQTLGFVQIDKDVVLYRIEEDIVGGEHPESKKAYTFSDGVGRISLKLAARINEELGLTFSPSAYQIRFKGCKGLLVIDPYMEDSQEKEILVVRKSMLKFESDSWSLEILKVSEDRAVYLNRPLMNLLDGLGTDGRTVKKLLFDNVKKLTDAFLDDCKAAKLIRDYSSLLSMLIDVPSLADSGFKLLQEPFFKKCVQVIVKERLRDLKYKARIRVPDDGGRIMFGVMDEYCVLEPGQVFVQYSPSKNQLESNPELKPKILTGEIMVTKYPCMHPGDVRKFMAVNHPKLQHIKDCIVFPQKGHRPHPNEMAGSDLDGDEYSVIWMESLYFEGENRAPMVFPDSPSENPPTEVKVHDIFNFFIEFIQGNCVGRIATTHLAFTDDNKDTINSDKAKDLCLKYSIALDFAKTGRNVSIDDIPKQHHFPDFMSGIESNRSTYRSDRVLGEIYQLLLLFELVLECDSDFSKSELDSDLVVEGWKKFEKVAEVELGRYQLAIDRLLQYFMVENEVSLLTNKLAITSRHSIGKHDASNLQRVVDQEVQKLKEDFKLRFLSLKDSNNNNLPQSEKKELLLQKASAYYIVALRNRQERFEDGGKCYLGFPFVIVGEELEQIKRKNKSSDTSNEQLIANLSDYLNDGTIDQEHKTLDPEQVMKIVFHRVLQWFDAQLRQVGLPTLEKNEDVVDKFKTPLPAMIKRVSENLDHEKVTSGNLFLLLLHEMKENMFNQDDPNPVAGLFSLGSLVKIYSQSCIDHLFSVKSTQRKLRIAKHHISLNVDQKFRENVINKYLDRFLTYLKDESSIENVSCNVYSKGDYHYLVLVALGSDWSLRRLEHIVRDRTFFVKTCQYFEQNVTFKK